MADAITAHDEALKFGGVDGIISLDLVQSAIARPYSGYYRAIASKAAVLLHGVVGNHGFADGNKRTAWLLLEILVQRSGYVLTIPDDEPIDDLVVAVAAHDMDLQQLTNWFQNRLQKA